MLNKLLYNITNIATILCDAPICFITLKKNNNYELLCVNGVVANSSLTNNIFLEKTLHHFNKYFIVENIKNEIIYDDEILVKQSPFIHFYAGFCIIGVDGKVIGCLSILDIKPKQLSSSQINSLKALAQQAAEIIVTQHENKLLSNKINDLQKTNTLYEQTNLVAKIGYWEVNFITNEVYWSATTKAIHGVAYDYVPEMNTAINFFKEGWSRERITACVHEASINDKPYDEELQIITKSGEQLWVRTKGNAEFYNDKCIRLFGTFQDINNYKKQQLAVEESEIKYRLIFENSLTAFLLTKPDGSILDGNKAAENMFGYSMDKLIKLGRNGIIDTTDSNLQTFIKERQINGKAQAELFGIRNGGGRFPFFVTSSIFEDANGEVRTSLSMIDITESKKAAEDLRISKEEFSTTFQYASIGMALVSNNGKWIRVNNSLCNMLGYTNTELLQKSFQDISHPDDLHKDLTYLQQLINDEIETYQMEKRYFTKNGEMLWVNLSVSKVRNADGTLKHLISQIENINKRKNAEQQLALSEQRFKGIFNSSFQLIGFLSPDGIILEVNETALNFAGITLEDVVGKNYWECPWWKISKETQHRLKDAVAKAANGQFEQYEVEIAGANNNKLTVLFNLKPLIDTDNNVIAIIAEGRPIQDIADARKSLLQKNEELKEFSAIASHDLKEPLRMIHIFMQMLEKNYAMQLDEKANKYITTAIDGAKRMAVLVDDLLTYSQVGSEQAEKEKINTNELVEEIISFQQKVFIDKEIHFEISNLPNIFALKTPIKMLFENLIGNALKYQKTGVIPSIKITSTQINNKIEFAVSDNGIGIAEKYNEQIFKLFKRLHSRSEFTGTGMGLSTCKKIVENHGGQIWVKSIEGEGSTFYFTLNIC